MINPRQRLGPISFRNKALQDILSSSKQAVEVLSVEAIDNPIHNTKIIDDQTLELSANNDQKIIYTIET